MKHDTPSPTVRKLLVLPEDMARRIADYRFGQRIPSESEATRRLIDIGLAAAQQPQEVIQR
jgi:hypothetical protein